MSTTAPSPNNFYQHGLPQPFHISAGALLFNDQTEICTHHFYATEVSANLLFLLGGLSEGYHLMRESLEGDESLQTAVHRGLYEEFGATGTIEKYLGSQVCMVTTPERQFEKLTVYHAVRLIELGDRPDIDAESRSKMEWYSAVDLLSMYEKQAAMTDRPELNETEIIRRFMTAYGL